MKINSGFSTGFVNKKFPHSPRMPTKLFELTYPLPTLDVRTSSAYTKGNMSEFTPGFSPVKYVFHLLMLFGFLTLLLGALVSSNLIILLIVGVVIFVLLYELYSLKSQRIIVEDTKLTFFRNSIFTNEVTRINLADVSSFELLTYQGRYDLVTRHSIKFRTAVNKDEPQLYNEIEKTLDLSLWDNSHVQTFVTYLKNNYPSVIWR